MIDTTSGSAWKPNGFRILGQELWRRTSEPVGQTVFWAYFVIGVVALGGLGLFLEVFRALATPSAERSWAGAYTSMLTFFPALVGTSSLQMIFEARPNRRLQAFCIVYAVLTAVVAVALFASAGTNSWLTWPGAMLSCCAAMWIWWVANADNRSLHDEPPGDDAVGGAPDAPLAGDIGRFKV